MQILVCLKWVPLRPDIDPLTGSVTVDERFCGASPADESALEWALRLAESSPSGPGSVVAVTVGPPAAAAMLRNALAAGVDDAILIDAAADAPSEAVAAELAALVTSKPKLDLVCTGLHSLDRGSGSVPAFLAALLDWPQALGLVGVEANGFGAGPGTDLADPDPIMVERRLDRGQREQLAVTGPAVLSFERGPELRRASLVAMLAAGSSEVRQRPATGNTAGPTSTGRPARPTHLRVVGQGPFRPPTTVEPAPQGTTRDRLIALTGGTGHRGTPAGQVHEVEPADAAELVVRSLTEWGYLADDDDDDDDDPARPDGTGGPNLDESDPEDSSKP